MRQKKPVVKNCALFGLPEPELPEGELPKLDKLNAEQLYNYADIQKKHYAEALKVTIPEGLAKVKDRLNKT